MAIETWDSPYIVIWLCLGVLATVLTLGVRGYSGKLNGLEAAFYGVVIGGLAILDGAVLGQTMYDKTEKVWGNLGTMLGLSGSLIVSGLILIVFYRNRVVKHPDEVTVKGEDLEINKSYLLGGITSFMTYGLLAAGIGAMNIVMDIVEDKEGIIYGLAGLVPLVIAIWLIAKYSKYQ